jgi:hypothetical protein
MTDPLESAAQAVAERVIDLVAGAPVREHLTLWAALSSGHRPDS